MTSFAARAYAHPGLAADGERWLAGLFGSSGRYAALESAAQPALLHGVSLPFAFDSRQLWQLVASRQLDVAANEFRLVRAEAGQQAEIAAHRYAREAGARLVPEPSAVRDFYGDGATLAFQRLDRKLDRFSHYCAALSARLGHPVQLSAYLSPAQSQGLDIHHDTHDVIIVQIEGEKRFDLFEEIVARPVPRLPLQAAQAARARHVCSCTLQPGDLLYLPRGIPHRAESGARDSLHVTLGVLALTWAAVVDDLARELHLLEPLRRSCAAGEVFDAAALHAAASEAADALAGWLRTDGTPALRRLLHRPPAAARARAGRVAGLLVRAGAGRRRLRLEQRGHGAARRRRRAPVAATAGRSRPAL